MKKNLLLALLGLFLISAAQAQNTEAKYMNPDQSNQQIGLPVPNQFYVRLGVGLSGGTTSNLDMLYKYTNDGNKETVEVVPVDLGSGFTGSVAFGYMVKKYLGFELTVSQSLGFPNFGDSIMRFPGGYNITGRILGNVLSVTPSVLITAGLSKVNPYARFGMVIGVVPTMYGKLEATQATNPPNDIVLIRKYYGGVALGFSAALGVDFNISKIISLYAEATFQGLTWSPFYSKITKYTINGTDHLGDLTTFEKETEYYSKLDINAYVSPDVPKKELRKTYPFDNAGVTLGVRFKF
ncbi:MAG: outer membrane beta-barrel protein [Bacteroidales bacterium]|nr:outer membrane beta-barrel protein [Bacteroidales bacterium]